MRDKDGYGGGAKSGPAKGVASEGLEQGSEARGE